MLVFIWLFSIQTYFIQLISYSSVTNINLFLNPFVFHLLFCTFWILLWVLYLDAFTSFQYVFLFQPPHFFYICTKFLAQLTRNNQHHQRHSAMDCFFESVLQSFSLFQLKVLLLESCFLSIVYAKPFVIVCKNYLLTFDQFAYLGFCCNLF